MSRKTLVLYHGNCLDGMASANIIRNKLGKENVELVACLYSDPVPALNKRKVFIVDFSWKPEFLLPAVEKAESVVMIDHHDSAIKNWVGVTIPENMSVVFDMSKSGGGIVWDYFHPNEPFHPVYAALQDYDLHTFKVDNSYEVASCLKSTGVLDTQDFDLFDHWVKNVSMTDLIDRGTIALDLDRVTVQGILMRAKTMVHFCGYTVPVANMPAHLATLAGGMMCKDYPFSITYEDQLKTGLRKFDLRAVKGSAIHCGDLARAVGGGGHQGAAGFYMPLGTPDLHLFNNEHVTNVLLELKTLLENVTGVLDVKLRVSEDMIPDAVAFVKEEMVRDYSEVVSAIKLSYEGSGVEPLARLLMLIARAAFPEQYSAISEKVKQNTRS